VFLTKILENNKVAVVKLTKPLEGEVSVNRTKLIEMSPSLTAGFILIKAREDKLTKGIFKFTKEMKRPGLEEPMCVTEVIDDETVEVFQLTGSSGDTTKVKISSLVEMDSMEIIEFINKTIRI